MFYNKKEFREYRNRERYDHYYNTLVMIISSMFKYENLPVGLSAEYIERAFIKYGSCGICSLPNGKLYSDRVTMTNDVNEYGIGTKGSMVTRNGKYTVVGNICYNNDTPTADTKIVVGWNNSQHTPDFDIGRFTEMFCETDISMLANIKNSRVHPIPVAKNNKVREALNTVLSRVRNGELDTVLNELTFSDNISNNNDPTIPVLNITDPSEVTRLQYLSKFHDDLLRRIATLYGQPMQTSGKMAQQTTEEIDGYNTFSMIVPYNRLQQRKKWIENVNKTFGTNIVVKFNDAWELNEFNVDVSERITENEEGDKVLNDEI